ncbi:hypothetical protein EDB87DRAFT_390191 [Lactarius vividus]|nr:hypothetical protein EDB87DRAFT_390191 [Lactarius vividus]
MELISPVVDVLHTSSGTLGGVAGLAFPPAGVIFTGIGVLLSVAKDVRASHDALVELFERIESFFQCIVVYTQISLTTEMAGVLVKIMTEVLSILSIATKEVKPRRASEFLGRTDIEDALKRLDGLIQEEVRMAMAQTMNHAQPIRPVTHLLLDHCQSRRCQECQRQYRRNEVFMICYSHRLYYEY